ncbi:TPA: fimbrillin family protein [Elizabethkingia anophelis]
MKRVHKKLLERVFILTLPLCILSCRSSDNGIINGSGEKVNVSINLIGSSADGELTSGIASSGKMSSSASEIQKQVIPFNENYSITASLIPQSRTVINNASATINPIAAGTPLPPSELNPNVKYKVSVYDADGVFVAENEFTYGQPYTSFALDGDKNYTFVAYSINSTLNSPSVTGGGNLSTAKLTGISGDLMYFKKNMTVTGNGPNRLDVVLKHRFSQVTAKLDASNVESTGIITRIDTPTITGGSATGELVFSNDQQINYAGTGNVPVSFASINKSVVDSNPAIIIGDTPNGGVLGIKNIIIDGISKDNFQFNNLKISPGTKYNLNLRVTPCTRELIPATSFDQDASVVGKLFTFSGIPDRFIVDINYWDNSFNLNVNGVNIGADEFQSEAGAGTRNLKFADGTFVPVGYTITVNFPTPPAVRVVIDKNGNVSLFGKRTSASLILEPLTYSGTGGLRTMTWNPGVNNVTLTQVKSGVTRIRGVGYVKQNITCP